jgi:hypothetical protein
MDLKFSVRALAGGFSTGSGNGASITDCSKILLQSPKFLFSHKISLAPERWKKSRKFRQFEAYISYTLREIEYHYIA